MELQVLAIRENGASTILPQRFGALRVLLILRDPEGGTRSTEAEPSRSLVGRFVQRRAMRSIPAALA